MSTAVAAIYGMPAVLIGLLALLRWPQLMHGVAVALIVSSAACLLVELAATVPIGLLIYGYAAPLWARFRVPRARWNLIALAGLTIGIAGIVIWSHFRLSIIQVQLIIQVRRDYRAASSVREEPRARFRDFAGATTLAAAVIHAIGIASTGISALLHALK
jgi:hypothetical protein